MWLKVLVPANCHGTGRPGERRLSRINPSSMTIAALAVAANLTAGCFGCRLSPSQRVSYAAQRINSARNGMTSKFGWLQASATRLRSVSITSVDPATIRM